MRRRRDLLENLFSAAAGLPRIHTLPCKTAASMLGPVTSICRRKSVLTVSGLPSMSGMSVTTFGMSGIDHGGIGIVR